MFDRPPVGAGPLFGCCHYFLSLRLRLFQLFGRKDYGFSQLGHELLTSLEVRQCFDSLFFSSIGNWTRDNARLPSGEVVDELVRKTELSTLTLVSSRTFVPVASLQFKKSIEHRFAFQDE